MGQVVNFNRAKKARAKAEKEPAAAANRARHGRTKEEASEDAKEADRRDQLLDGAKIED